VDGWLRLIRSSLKGEVSTADLVARRRAGTAAYALAEEASATDGTDRGTQLFKVCAWNAFALQSIADTILDLDAKDDPSTAGYVPRSTLRFVTACIEEVPRWIRNARVVQGDPSIRLGTTLPALLPRWRFDESTRMSELRGLRAAYECLQPRVESEVESSGIAEARRLFAEMTSTADYAAMMLRPDSGAVDRGEVRWRLLQALGGAYALGQVLAMPTLAELARVSRERDEGLPLSANSSWLQIGDRWPVLDAKGDRIGAVERVRGDRSTGLFEGIDVDVGSDRATLTVPAAVVARIGSGEVRLSIRQDEVQST
jgi:hypothetical protein